MNVLFVCFAIACGCVFDRSSAIAYTVSTIEHDSVRTHENIILKTVAFLEEVARAGHVSDVITAEKHPSISINRAELREIVSILQANKETLMTGVRDAEYASGMGTLRESTVSRNSFSHYYNPDTQLGYRAAAHVPGLQKLASMGLLPPAFTEVLGPSLGADKIADWYYARALHFMHSDIQKALHDLAYCLHILQVRLMYMDSWA